MTKEEFKEARKTLGMTQTQMGDRLYKTRQQISNYENGKTRVPELVIGYVIHLVGEKKSG